jgi:uncharacterized protein YndB with AHSA1/START domain
MTDTTSREITVTKIVDAPCDLVFKAWTEAEHLQRWWGPDGFTVSSASSDPREGGAFEIVMHGPDGNDYPLTGTYREFKPPHRIVSDMTASGPDGAPALQAVATLTFVDHDGKTEITVHERADALIPEAALMLAGMEIGMVQSLRRLDDFLTGAADRQIVLTRMLEVPATSCSTRGRPTSTSSIGTGPTDSRSRPRRSTFAPAGCGPSRCTAPTAWTIRTSSRTSRSFARSS